VRRIVVPNRSALSFTDLLLFLCVGRVRSGIVMAIAEKVNTMLPGIYDASEFQ
jgi:hypothetical protein